MIIIAQMNSHSVPIRQTLDKLRKVSSLETLHYKETYIYVLLMLWHVTGFER